ncbi:hypothetical protein PAECIP111802_03110 [Paenibacillus allorhizosphaerae]|uniref:Uncharacterized protein n=1 Tax=Paenibacillus allorhizosphaerae TaxID=2849866 RepID=A0ABM8VIB0_9BACL|nr:hypothetical protein PAECIP111802_03110 [Paenibacillus allorhizosphaerae]
MQNNVIINTDIHQGTINKHIYGHFAEHLGRCIYEGIWVGEHSTIPNTDGIRNDVLEALKKLDPQSALARRVLCGRIPLGGRRRSPCRAKTYGQHALGWCGRK